MTDFYKKLQYASLILIIFSCISPVSAQEETFLKTKIEKIGNSKRSEINQINQVLRNLDIPKEIGMVKETYMPRSPKANLIITIQDLHCHYQAQKNIAAILNYLTNNFALKLISIEGGAGPIDTVFYRELPDERIKEQVAEYFLKEARINGTEYFAITTNKEIALYGAEDSKYYDWNLEAFLDALPKREKILKDVAVLENALNILKDRIYNKRLKELDNYIVAYENKTISFEDYILNIEKQYSKTKLIRDFKQVAQLAESIHIKREVNLVAAEKQRGELIDYLSTKLPRRELEEFLRITLEFKTKTVKASEYHSKLKELYEKTIEKTKTFEQNWPDLSEYIVYLDKYETLDDIELFNEIDKALDGIKNSLYTSYTQKKLDRNLTIIRLARNLFSTKLLPRDLPIIDKYRNEFNAKKMAKFIKRQSRRLTLDLPVPAELEDIEDTLPMVEDFYYYASQRNEILVDNTLAYMKKENQDVGILITGGFHTDGITEDLRDKRIPYVVVIPQIDALEENDTRYIDALKGKKTRFETMLEGATDSVRDFYFGK
ncbi:MAG: hypothetical protein GY853_03295 [PVC group bacterium]|nr:hypothetical protein [PVC group bacterium]